MISYVCFSRSLRSHKGFNLVEAAIVLGVIGLVIGGIWTAASSMNDNMKWNQTEAGYLYYASEIAKLQTQQTSVGCTYSTCNMMVVFATHPVPAGWSKNTQTNNGFRSYDPFGNPFYAEIVLSGSRYITNMGPAFHTVTDKLYCARLLRMMVDKVGKLMQFLNTSGGGSCTPQAGYGQDYYYTNCCSTGTVTASFVLPSN